MAEPPFKGEQQHTDIVSPGQKFCLLQKSALDGAALHRESIDLTITSPPYNLGIDYSSYNDSLSYQDYLTFSETWLRNCYFWSKETGRLCLNVPLDINKGDKHSLGADITILPKLWDGITIVPSSGTN